VYWAQPSAEHSLVGYRRRILDAMHGTRAFKGELPLRRCRPPSLKGLDVAKCEHAQSQLKTLALSHIQKQMDAVLCSIVSDIRTLRLLAHQVTHPDDRPLSKRLPPGEISAVCQKKLRQVAIGYTYR
jgi:hypothetical protein